MKNRDKKKNKSTFNRGVGQGTNVWWWWWWWLVVVNISSSLKYIERIKKQQPNLYLYENKSEKWIESYFLQ